MNDDGEGIGGEGGVSGECGMGSYWIEQGNLH